MREMASVEILNQLVLDALPSGILFCDTACVVRKINACYAALLGGKVASILGRPLPELNPFTRAPQVIKNGRPELGDLCTLPLFGDDYKFVVNRIPVRDEEGKVIGMVSHILFTDPNELKALHDKIELLYKKKKIYNHGNSSGNTRYDLDSIVGECPLILEVKRRIEIYSRDLHPVLVCGNTGTGKELVAQALHSASAYAAGPFVSINCAAIPSDLLEAELFGYAPGAFSGAHKSGKMGLLECSNNGTLFLDEIGDIPLYTQVKLLRTLEEKEVMRVGSVTPVKINFRLVTATNRDLRDMVREGSFREDFYYRINALNIQTPPLCERGEDIMLLSRHILSKLGYGRMTFTAESTRLMLAYTWPGNVRQLFNALVHASIHCTNDCIDIIHLPGELRQKSPVLAETSPAVSGENSLSDYIGSQEASYLLSVLRKNNGNVSTTAKELGISRVALYGKFRKYGIQRGESQKELKGSTD